MGGRPSQEGRLRRVRRRPRRPVQARRGPALQGRRREVHREGGQRHQGQRPQRIVGYKGSYQKGSAPVVDASGGKSRFGGVVYRFGEKYKGNIDEYSPIFTPEYRQRNAAVYEPGILGLAIWAAGFVGLLAVGGFAIYTTSALA